MEEGPGRISATGISQHGSKEVVLAAPDNNWARERVHRALYERSYKRLKRRGLDEAEAEGLATEIAKRATERTQPPDFASGDKLAATVYSVCEGLSKGKSYYELIRERPYLATGRIDRLVAVANSVRPQVPPEIALAAKRATGLERLSGGLAVAFTAVALVALGIWWALGIGFFVAVGGELYLQIGMPPSARQAVARFRVPQWLGFLAVFAFIYVGYEWADDRSYAVGLAFGLVAFALFIGFLVPGLTLAFLVGRRERRWRRDLERELLDERSGGTDD